MINYEVSDLLEVQKGLLVHGCNAQGAMGRGIALAIKKKYPEAFKTYRQTYLLQGNQLHLGQCILEQVSSQLTIVNAVTQNRYDLYTPQVDYDAIEKAMTQVGILARQTKADIHMPKIGCGLAGGDWKKVEAILNKVIPPTVKVYVHVQVTTDLHGQLSLDCF